MTDIKAAFFDIDGTLLPFQAKKLPDSTLRALDALRKNGVKTFIATGRPPVHLPYLHALDGIPFDGYVTMNGQYCYMADGELLYSQFIDKATLRTLLPYIEAEKISVGFVGKDFCLFNIINDLSRDFALELQQEMCIRDSLNGVPATNSVETYLDGHFDNDRMHRVYPKAVHTG